MICISGATSSISLGKMSVLLRLFYFAQLAAIVVASINVDLVTDYDEVRPLMKCKWSLVYLRKSLLFPDTAHFFTSDFPNSASSGSSDCSSSSCPCTIKWKSMVNVRFFNHIFNVKEKIFKLMQNT